MVVAVVAAIVVLLLLICLLSSWRWSSRRVGVTGGVGFPTRFLDFDGESIVGQVGSNLWPKSQQQITALTLRCLLLFVYSCCGGRKYNKGVRVG